MVVSFTDSTNLDARIFLGGGSNMLFYNDTGYDFTFTTDAGWLSINPEVQNETIKYGGGDEECTLSLPQKSGTIALTSDVPNKTYLHNITVSYQKYTWFTFNLLSSSSTPLTTVSAIVGAARDSGVFKCGCFGWDMANSGTTSGDIHFLNSVTFSSYAGTLSLYFSYQLFFDKSAGTMSVNSFATTDYVLSGWSINDNVSTYL